MIIIKSTREENTRVTPIAPPYFIDQQENGIYICKLGEDISSFSDILGEYESEERAKEVMGMIEEHIRDSTISKMIAPSAKEISELDESVSDNTIDIMGSLIIFTMPE